MEGLLSVLLGSSDLFSDLFSDRLSDPFSDLVSDLFSDRFSDLLSVGPPERRGAPEGLL